jgi:acetylornithine deacetylase/succinyl-diaminopimelate desuccinylase-like protein
MKRVNKRKTVEGNGMAGIWKQIQRFTRTPEFETYLRELLLELCRVDTTPNPKVQRMAKAESACFSILERELHQLGFVGLRTERRPINPGIKRHKNYSLLHFTKTTANPAGLTPEEAYADRANLVCFIPGAGNKSGGKSVAVNAHVDVVAPYIPPRYKNGIVFGRGACDDKGPVVSVIAALKALSKIMPAHQLTWNQNVLGMFVVEEETGGNGSLSLAIDRELKAFYDSIVVYECAGMKLHPANRGAVWYRLELAPPRGASAFEMFAFVNEELEKEGASIRAESRHALFPQRPVQTCHGIIGPFGEHPSRICGEVAFDIRFDKKPGAKAEELIRDILDFALAGYVGLYGDKNLVKDPATGKSMVPVHYKLTRNPHGFEVRVYGATGHMGAIRERDGAITKMAHFVRGLLRSRKKIEQAGGAEFCLELAGTPAGKLVLEGGQGFVPTHEIEEVMDRLREAAKRGAANYLKAAGLKTSAEKVVMMTYEKLHNVAFDGDPASDSMKHALAAARQCGLAKDEPVLGWTVSCDARLFATEYPGMDVITSGPGQLSYAHSDHEQITIRELREAAEFLALFLLRQTGSIKA